MTHHILICLEGHFEEDHLLQVIVHDAAELRGKGKKVNIYDGTPSASPTQ